MAAAAPDYNSEMIIPAQVRAARAWLGWTRAKLAAEAGVSAESVRDFEIGRTDPRQSTLGKSRRSARPGSSCSRNPGAGRELEGEQPGYEP
jgi:DNA-binding XRE family transcriptional regulator